jgi:hypothetical protein
MDTIIDINSRRVRGRGKIGAYTHISYINLSIKHEHETSEREREREREK